MLSITLKDQPNSIKASGSQLLLSDIAYGGNSLKHMPDIPL